MDKPVTDLNSHIEWLKEKIEYNANCKDMNKHARNYIGQLGDLKIPPEDLVKKGLLNYMKSVGQRFSRLKKEADVVGKKWQLLVDQWKEENRSIMKLFVEQPFFNPRKPIDGKQSPHLNGTWKANQRNSDSDYGQNFHSSSSQEVESPDSQKHNQRNSFFKPNNHSYPRKSFSPLQLENPSSRNTSSAEFNANLAIDPKEVIPINKAQESPVKLIDRFCVQLKENMFKAVKLRQQPLPENMDKLLCICEHLNLPLKHYPRYLREYQESLKSQIKNLKENSDSSNYANSLNGKSDKKIDSHHLPSTSQQGAMESSKSYPDRKKHIESNQSIVKVKELKEEQQPSLAGKVKHRESTLSVSRDLKKEQKPAQDVKPRDMARTHSVVKGKELKVELQSAAGRTLKHKETIQSVAKVKELNVEQRAIQDSKLDAKRVSTMAQESRHCDKNNIKKRESPDQSAMIAITSSKKERTSVYHGGRKCEMPKLKDLSIRALLRGLKQTSDPAKYVNRDASFETLEPILVQISPVTLHKIEEEKKYLIASTDQVWKLNCNRRFKSLLHLKHKNEPWRAFFGRCCVESSEKLKNVTASINASTSKVKPDRQIKLTTVDGPPTKRQKTDYAVKCNGNNSTVKMLPNSTQSSNSRSVAPIPPKGTSNHIKPSHRTTKKDAPLMHKAKKTMGQLNRIHRN